VRSRPGMARTAGDAWLGKKSRHLKTRASGEGAWLGRRADADTKAAWRAGAVRAGARRQGAERGAVPTGSKRFTVPLFECVKLQNFE
jgi:hypothetical protein